MRVHNIKGRYINVGTISPIESIERTANQIAWKVLIDKWVEEGAPDWFAKEERKCECGADITHRHYRVTLCESCRIEHNTYRGRQAKKRQSGGA